MRDNSEPDPSSAIDYIQNRQHFTVIQAFSLGFVLAVGTCVWIPACDAGADAFRSPDDAS